MHYYSVGKFLAQEHEELKKATEKAYEYTSLDREFFTLVNPKIVRLQLFNVPFRITS